MLEKETKTSVANSFEFIYLCWKYTKELFENKPKTCQSDFPRWTFVLQIQHQDWHWQGTISQ